MKKFLWLALVVTFLSSCKDLKPPSGEIVMVGFPIKSAEVSIDESTGKPHLLTLNLWNDHSPRVKIHSYPGKFLVHKVKFKLDPAVKEALVEFTYKYDSSFGYYFIPDKEWGWATIVLPNQDLASAWQKTITQIKERPKRVVVPTREDEGWINVGKNLSQ